MSLRKSSTAAVPSILLCLVAVAQEKETDNTLKLPASGKPGMASIADMAWLGGKDCRVRDEIFKDKRIEKR